MTAPDNNGFAEKHGLYSDREKLYQRLDDDEKKLVIEISKDLMDRIPGEIGAYEREAIRNIAVDTVKRWRSNEYIIESDLVKDGSQSSHRAQQAYSRIVRDTTSELEKLGLLEDGPEMKKAEAQAGWMEQISEASDGSDNE